MMFRLMPHMALAALLLTAPALADEIDGMHVGLNGFRPGIGNELSSRWEPYVQQRERAAIVNRLSPEWGHYTDRDPGLDPPKCRDKVTETTGSEGTIRWNYAECYDGDGAKYVLPSGPDGFTAY